MSGSGVKGGIVNYEIDREDIVLLLVDAVRRLTKQDELKGITRLEKLIFLLAREKKLVAAQEQFSFKPYKFGPFSQDVYEATDFLKGLDLLKIEERPRVSYYATTEEELLNEETSDVDSTATVAHEKTYSLTPNGEKVVHELREIWRKERPEDLARIEDIVRRFATLPLSQIIRYVYHRHSDMTVNSIHPEAARLQNY